MGGPITGVLKIMKTCCTFGAKHLWQCIYFPISMSQYNRGREGVKTVKTFSRCVMRSRPDVMQLLFFFPSPQKNTGWPWRREVWGNSVLWSVCMSVLVFHWAFFLHLRNTDVRVYHCYAPNRLQTAAVRQKQLTDFYKQTTAKSAGWFNDHELPRVHDKQCAQCSELHDWGVQVILCFSVVKRTILTSKTASFKKTKIQNTEMQHETHQIQVMKQREQRLIELHDERHDDSECSTVQVLLSSWTSTSGWRLSK